jgi:hypothetical protein
MKPLALARRSESDVTSHRRVATPERERARRVAGRGEWQAVQVRRVLARLSAGPTAQVEVLTFNPRPDSR